MNFGRLDAESDENLEQYFVETGAVSRVAEGKSLVLGRKGAGKTALFKHLKRSLNSTQTVVDLDLDGYYFKSHKRLVESGVDQSHSYTNAWKLVLYTAMLGELSQELSKDQKKELDRIFAELAVADNRSTFQKIVDWLKNIKSIDLPKVDGLFDLGGIEFNSTDEGFTDRFVECSRSIEQLALSVIKEHPVTVLVDRLDDGWDGSEESKNFIIGALRGSSPV